MAGIISHFRNPLADLARSVPNRLSVREMHGRVEAFVLVALDYQYPRITR